MPDTIADLVTSLPAVTITDLAVKGTFRGISIGYEFHIGKAKCRRAYGNEKTAKTVLDAVMNQVPVVHRLD